MRRICLVHAGCSDTLRYIVAARGSRLSISQTNLVLNLIRRYHTASFEISTITTRGDRERKPLFRMGKRGVFEKEVNEAVVHGKADFAVHSMKDVPGMMHPKLTLAAVPVRGPPDDVLICRAGLHPDDIGPGMVVGTSSLRRLAQAHLAYPGITVRPIRGNVDTRIKKLDAGYDALILARAGLERLNLDVPYAPLPIGQFVPSPGQGALAVVARADDHQLLPILQHIEHAPSRLAAEAERALSGVLESGCRFPVGAYARVSDDGIIHMTAAAYREDGGDPIYHQDSGTDPHQVGRDIGRAMIESGADSLALKWRQIQV